MSLLVSIIIPSAGRRPKFLQRAIKSALIDDGAIQTEIIVVLNGKDGVAFDTNDAIQHRLVKYHKIKQGNVSKARNYGLALAQGNLIRFLDDDDFLYPDVAYQQYLELLHSDAHLSTYAGAIEDNNTRYQIIKPIKIEDYCAATLSPYCPALTFATVYKSKTIKHLKWDEYIFVVEDEKWMRTIAASTEIKWLRSNEVVAVWYQHDIDRLSLPIGYPELYRNRCISIKETLQKLEAENRLTVSRKINASSGLWSAVHGGLYSAPIYWTKVALYARKLDPQSKPDDAFFQKLPNWIHPLVIEWLMLPKRWLNHLLRVVKHKLRYNKSFVRKF